MSFLLLLLLLLLLLPSSESMAATSGDGVSCVFRDCDNTTSACVYTCVWPDPFLSAPPPPPPPSTAEKSARSHVAPFLIATVCILGISFLLLTTCTIILRYRFSRRRQRRNSPADGDSPIDGDDPVVISVVDHPIWHITTVGLQQSVIDSIVAFKYQKLEGFLTEGSDCSVCLTEFEEGDDLRLLPKCSHAFHVSCIDTWLRSHKNCPLCRAPVVNEVSGSGISTMRQSISSNLDHREEEAQMENLEDDNGGLELREGENSNQLRERGDDLGDLPIEGKSMAAILKKNRDLRILSDLGENHRFREAGDGLEPIRRSISYSSLDASAMFSQFRGSVDTVCSVVGNEGSSSNTNPVPPEKKTNSEKAPKRGSSMSGLLLRGPVSMKRSFSSSGKFFSFHKAKSQASILPL